MKKLDIYNKQDIHLEGFGVIEINEGLDGKWHIDLFPRGSSNIREKICIETSFSSTASKIFETPKENKDRIDQIYG